MPVDTTFEGLDHFTAVWVWDNSATAYVDRTIAAQITTDAAFAIFEDANDWLYLGSQSRSDLFSALLSTLGVVSGLVYQYYNGSSWVRTVPRHEYDYTFSGAEAFENLVGWASLAFSGTVPHAATPPDTTERYWIRIGVTSVTTAPTVSEIRMRPLAAYCTPTDVRSILQLGADFSSSTTPTRNAVEDTINAAQSRIDFMTQQSWRLNVKYDEYHEFNIAGCKLIERDVRNLLRVRIWSGAEWQLKTEGRQNDYFLVPQEGMMYWSRYFLLPARMQSYNAPVWLWGWAEFTFPVRVDYTYGRVKATDAKRSYMVFDIARKLAAIDIYQSHDYSILVASGSDKVGLDRKIENWKIETEDKLESLRGWVVF